MTVLRQKMIEDMQLRGFALRTQEAYRTLELHFTATPRQIRSQDLVFLES